MPSLKRLLGSGCQTWWLDWPGVPHTRGFPPQHLVMGRLGLQCACCDISMGLVTMVTHEAMPRGFSCVRGESSKYLPPLQSPDSFWTVVVG